MMTPNMAAKIAPASSSAHTLTWMPGIVLYLAVMVAIIVAVDFAFFRNRFWERLAVNIGIVLVFAAFYFRFLRRP